MGRSKENVKTAHKKGFKKTNNQLKNWGIKFHQLKFGKNHPMILLLMTKVFFLRKIG